VLVSDPKGRDIKIDAYTLSFHGRLLVEGAEVALNYGQRYGLLGDNGSGKVRSDGLLYPRERSSEVLLVDIPTVHCRTGYPSTTSYRHIPCPWRG
jgi:hypothetical protein